MHGVSALQPNEVDQRRIERALASRRRYKYVQPRVQPTAQGYEIFSPNCSRNISPEGGEIPIARLCFDEAAAAWHVARFDHVAHCWCVLAQRPRLHEALAYINEDPLRQFWP